MKLSTLFAVAGRSAVITGGASGIGLAIADILSDQGAHVTLLDRNAAKLDRALKQLSGREGRVRVAVCDVTDLDEAFREAEKLDRTAASTLPS